MMRHFLLAVQFLTIVSFKKDIGLNKQNVKNIIIFFPVVGLVIGAGLVVINNFLYFLKLNDFCVNTILVISSVIFTGGLHLDGLADTADAFFCGKDKETKLKILRDPQLGVMGTAAIVSVIFLKVSLLSMFFSLMKVKALLFMGVLSRYTLVFGLFWFNYARENGKAKIFFEGITKKTFIFASISVLLASFLFFQIRGIVFFLFICGIIYLFGRRIAKDFNGLTGDVLGALSELTEVFVLGTLLVIY